MNSVLNDLTYCDGRFEPNAHATFSDSPSRLKLRSNTFQGIRASLEKRRTPAKTNEFIIPSAALPKMKIEEDANQGGSTKEKPNNEFTYRNPAELESARNGASKKLKVGQKQHAGLVQTRDKHMPDMVPTQEVQENTVEEAKPITPPAQEIELPNVELPGMEPIQQNTPVVEPIVTPVPMKEEVKSEPVKEEMNIEVPSKEEIPTVRVEQKETKKDIAEEKVDEFAKLQKVTEKYQEAAKEFDQAQQSLDSAEQELSESKKQLDTTEREIGEKEEEITSQRNVIDTTRKEIASLQEEVQKVREEVKKKIIAIDKAREKKEREKRDLESKTKQAKETTSQYQQGIEANNKTLENLKKQSQELTDEESKVMNEKATVRSELERVEEILKAITLPEGAEEYVNEVVETPAMKTDSRINNFIPIEEPTPTKTPEEMPFEKTIGSYTRAA